MLFLKYDFNVVRDAELIMYNYIYVKKKYGTRKKKEIAFKKDQKTTCDKV